MFKILKAGLSNSSNIAKTPFCILGHSMGSNRRDSIEDETYINFVI
jgi:hypothetical protein